MRAARVNTATVGVFWRSLLEPKEGRFGFGWLDDTPDRPHSPRSPNEPYAHSPPSPTSLMRIHPVLA